MNKILNILYISTLCSPRMLEYLLKTSIIKPGQAVQKFHRLLVEGLSMNNDCKCDVLSSLPVIPKSHDRRFWILKSEHRGRIRYKYIPILNLPFLKNIIVFVFSFLTILFWVSFRSKKKVLICDILNLTISSATIFIAKLTGTKVIAIVTDLPGYMVAKKSCKGAINSTFISRLISKFDGYILLTEQMNAVVNPKNRPYIIMEGLVDINMENSENLLSNKAQERLIVYAGGIYERYGIKKLIEAFGLVDDKNLRLVIYGSGQMEKDMDFYMSSDDRIIYKGVCPNNEVVQMELQATLLVNPRPTHEEFTKYSFPSKNMEYMVSGTPLLTTRLPGMPQEYYQYVYLFDDESVQGMSHKLKSLLSKTDEELHNFGWLAKEFVLNIKSNKRQGKRIYEFMNNL